RPTALRSGGVPARAASGGRKAALDRLGRTVSERAARICHITTVHPADDHRILHKECVSLRAAGYDVTLIAPHHADDVIHGVPVVALPTRARNRFERMAQRPRAAYRVAIALDADLYHFHDPEFLPYGVRLA